MSPNRLAQESSLYLRQHADQPVDWYPWGEEAFALARATQRPILLSIGYSACHWCHVMAHESFADPRVAAKMNEWFVNVKVDREERPDVDALYMAAVQQLTGHGGWPLTVFLTPEGEPFFGGTYFPPTPRHGMPSFLQVLEAVHRAWVERPADVRRQAEELRQMLERQNRLALPPAPVTVEVLQDAYRTLERQFDPRHGGLAGAPKFPQPLVWRTLLQLGRRFGWAEAVAQVRRTLDAMAEGGLYDHLGGGFHRYSVDAQWRVPHFEKMLYDNALLADLYTRAVALWGRARDREVVDETLTYLATVLSAPEGGFYAAQDADSEGEEGRYYLWTPDEVAAAVGPAMAPAVCRFFGVEDAGPVEGRSVLRRTRPLAAWAAGEGWTEAEAQARLAEARAALRAMRDRRPPPAVDDKILLDWNALAVEAFALAGRVLRRRAWLARAERAADFLWDALGGPTPFHVWAQGRAKIPGFLLDYAAFGNALLTLHGATGARSWAERARALADALLDRFWDARTEGFFDTAPDADALVVRPRDLFDNPTPSGTSAAVRLLHRLAALTGEARYADVVERVLSRSVPLLREVPSGVAALLEVADAYVAGPLEVAIVGPAGDPALEALVDTAHDAVRTDAVVAVAADTSEAPVWPLLEGRMRPEGPALAYVCRRFACEAPVADPEALQSRLTFPNDPTVPR